MTDKLVNTLHDSIDEMEDLRARAREAVLAVWASRVVPFVAEVRKAAKGADDVEKQELIAAVREVLQDGLAMAAEDIADELDSVTSEGVRKGYENGKKLVGNGG